jgi:hypothetical protein
VKAVLRWLGLERREAGSVDLAYGNVHERPWFHTALLVGIVAFTALCAYIRFA